MTTTLETVEYYQSLLIMQYLNKTNATATVGATVAPFIAPPTSVQTIAFDPSPASGSFVLSYNDENTSAIAWDDTAGDIQTALQAVTGLSSVTVTGSIAAGLTVTFTGVTPPALSLVVETNTTGSTITIAETDVILPLAVQNAFNLLGSNIAAGVQLNVLGKYVGVSRTGMGFTTNITLDDADYLTLIQMAIIKNQSGSSLAQIQSFINQYFGQEMLVYDLRTMKMNYFISEVIGPEPLVQMFIAQGLLPKPMGVGISVFYPATKVFSFRTVQNETTGWPFNTSHDYQDSWQWLSSHNLLY